MVEYTCKIKKGAKNVWSNSLRYHIHVRYRFTACVAFRMKNPIAKYLMCSYAYYVEDNPLISDEEFDNLAKWLLEHWDAVDHPHKCYITKQDLEAGTYLGKYPSMIKGAVRSYRGTL